MNVMLIEDDPLFGTLILNVLAKEGHHVQRLTSMEEYTIDVISSFGPDLILMDIMLPARKGDKAQISHGGIELGLKKFHMKELNGNKDVPILFISIYNLEQSGPTETVPNILHPNWLTKPVEFDELISIIDSLEE